MNNNRSALTTGLIILAGIVVVVIITLLVNSMAFKNNPSVPTNTSLPLPTFTRSLHTGKYPADRLGDQSPCPCV